VADPPNATGKITSHKGWDGFTHTLAKTIPYQLTQGGNARKALYALMRKSSG
jgi:hypothetical protein